MTANMQRRIDLDGTTQAPAHARETTTSFLAEAERLRGRPASQNTLHAMLLVASELVSNAVRHAPGPCSLCLTLHDKGVLVEVSDTSPVSPRLRAPDTTGRFGGWGLQMVNRLAGELHTVPGPGDGKTVRARLPW
ncbi:ATP-binding protein [Streptomyces albidochromogenes]|uniref:ATP-binding protein n=1 Tax=Streptomyces albidochromogenes TaxID=329524 RepID=UPI00110F9160|nr:ATP-binding protein [Streptomyces albidochromogenes]